MTNLSILFDHILLAEIILEDAWMNRLRRVVEKEDEQGFELM